MRKRQKRKRMRVRRRLRTKKMTTSDNSTIKKELLDYYPMYN